MRVVRSPLSEREDRAILTEYNRLTGVSIPIEEFAHWVRQGPEGPAWHAILETDDGRIVGHTSVFPLRTAYRNSELIPAKSEYSFLHEDFRSMKIRGFENVARPAFIVLIDHLFQHCYAQGWGPIFASTNERNQVFTRKVGLRPVEFPLWECLLVLKPMNAARQTPNLEMAQRAALFAAGLSHRALWSVSALALRGMNGVRSVPVHAGPIEPDTDRFAFFQDSASLQWRYLDGQYVRFAWNQSHTDYVIAKRGSQNRYLRVCQWRLGPAPSYFPLVLALVREAQAEKAMGVRWAVYDDAEVSANLVKQLRKVGFLCARRTRTVMIHKKDPTFLEPKSWKINDSLFSFDP
jgi:GNAT superfamily N-acetyltransferase